MKTIVLSFCSLFSTETGHQTKTFLHILIEKDHLGDRSPEKDCC